MMSTEGFGGGFSRILLAQLFDFLGVSVSLEVFDIIHLALRKLAHLLEYSIFGFLLYRSFRDQDHPAWQPNRAAWALATAAAYSLTDELHQAMVRGRAASLLDSLIDSTGALLTIALIYLFSTKSRLGQSVTSHRG
ncbi:MAG: VanZ family protein [Acidobacteria bacterium]|nr:VanZ family protein [Acidobacteriota bacterium]